MVAREERKDIHENAIVQPTRRQKDPKISSTTAYDIRFELEMLRQKEVTKQLPCLRFTNVVMERRFQLYHEDISLQSSRLACAGTLLALIVMQAGAFYDLMVVQTNDQHDLDATHCLVVYGAMAINGFVVLLWTVFLSRKPQQREASCLYGRFQIFLFILGICVVLVVLGQPAYTLPHRLTSEAMENTDVRYLNHAHQLTKMIVFLLMAMSAIVTTWNMQFRIYVGIATFAYLTMWCWLILSPVYLHQQWHIIVLFSCSLFMLGRGLYRSESNLRLKFLRLRHLMLENIKLTQQNSVMQQQLSSHVDAIGINDDRKYNSNHDQHSLMLGESWMENVLKVLYHLKLQLSNDEDVAKELDFVMQTLTSEQDLFMENRLRRRRITQSQVEAEAGWLCLIEGQKQRRRKSCDIGGMGIVPVVKTIRRTDSGLRQTVLRQVENYLVASERHRLHPQDKQKPVSLLSTEKWTSQKLLARASRSEEFDILGFARECIFPLTSILLTTIESHNLLSELPLQVESAAEFGLEIESRYQAKLPYHNATHAASVVWDVNFFLRRLEQPVTSLQIFSALVAAAVHDVNHPGVNNAYLVNTNSPLAIKYSDDSVLERMHLAEAFQACTKDGCDIFEQFPKDMKRQCRQLIITMVLATDLSGHIKHVNRLKSKRYALHSTSTTDLTAASPLPSAQELIIPTDLVLQSIIMMADLGHAMKSFEHHSAWSKLVTEEFFRQGDTEKQFGLSVSPLCDRQNCKFEKSQIGFLEFVVLPLYIAVKEVVVFHNFDSVLDRIQQNTTIWRQKAEQLEHQASVHVPPGKAVVTPVLEPEIHVELELEHDREANSSTTSCEETRRIS